MIIGAITTKLSWGVLKNKQKQPMSNRVKLSLRNFSDSIMETAHKETKGGILRFSGGKKGKLEEIEYQKLVLAQQMANNLLRVRPLKKTHSHQQARNSRKGRIQVLMKSQQQLKGKIRQ